MAIIAKLTREPLYPEEIDNYIFFVDNDGLTKGQNGKTSRMEFVNPDAGIVFQNCVNALAARIGGGSIRVNGTTAVIRRRITIPVGSQICIRGNGKQSSVLNFDYVPGSIGEYVLDYLGVGYTYAPPWGGGAAWQLGNTLELRDLTFNLKHLNMSGVDAHYIDRLYTDNFWVRSIGTRVTAPATTIGIRTGPGGAGNGAEMHFTEASGFDYGMYLQADCLVGTNLRVADCKDLGMYIESAYSSILLRPEVYWIPFVPFSVFGLGIEIINPVVVVTDHSFGEFMKINANVRGLKISNPFACRDDLAAIPYLFEGLGAVQNYVILEGGVNGAGSYKKFQNWGTSVGTGIQQTIPHDIACNNNGAPLAPQRVLLSEYNTGAALAYESAAADATNIYVTAVLNKTYRWFASLV